MAKGQDSGTTILLGLKDYKVGEVWGGEEKVVVKTEVKGRIKCPHCGSGKLYGHGMCKPREILHSWSNGRRVYLELHRCCWKCHDCKRTFTEGRELVQSRSRLIRQAEVEALWQLKDRNFSQVRRELGVGYGTLHRFLEREMDEEALGFIQDEDEIYPGINEHSFRHQELVHTVTEVKQRKVLGILRDDRMATLKKFLSKVPPDKVREVCVDMKKGLRKAAEAVFPSARVVVNPFHVIADSNKRDIHRKEKVQIPKKIFLVGREKLTEERRQRVDTLLEKYPGLKGFYWGLHHLESISTQLDKEPKVLFAFGCSA